MTDAELSKALEVEAEREQLLIALRRIASLAPKDVPGHAQKIASEALRNVERGPYPSPRDDFSRENDPFHDEQQGDGK